MDHHNPNDQATYGSVTVTLQTGGYVGSSRDRGNLGIFLSDDRRLNHVGPVPGTGTYEGSRKQIVVCIPPIRQ